MFVTMNDLAETGVDSIFGSGPIDVVPETIETTQAAGHKQQSITEYGLGDVEPTHAFTIPFGFLATLIAVAGVGFGYGLGYTLGRNSSRSPSRP